MATQKTLVSIVGPTAVGKTSVAIALAKHFDSEILSADSRQIYCGLDIGTAKPTADEMREVKHHFIDMLEVEDDYNAGQFEQDALSSLAQLFERYDVAFMAGGSGLYFSAVWEGFDQMPKVDDSIREQLVSDLEKTGLNSLLAELEVKDPHYYEVVDRSNKQRVIRALEVIRQTGNPFSSYRKKEIAERPFQQIKIGLNLPRELLYTRIDSRMDDMIKLGLFEEAKKFESQKDLNALQTVGYREIFGYFDGEYDREEAIRLLKRNSRRYAKRQLTWLNRYEDIHWFKPSELAEMISLIESKIN